MTFRPPPWLDNRITAHGGLQQQPMPATVQHDPTASAVLGRSATLDRVDAGGGNIQFDLNQRPGLVRAEKLDWGLWSVTLGPMLGQGSPDPVGIISWGVGGARSPDVEFSWPLRGGSFTLNAEAIDLRVRASNADVVVAPTVNTPATVSAWLTPASMPANDAPLILQLADSTNVVNPIPMFARYLVVEPYDVGAGVFGAGEVAIRFTDPSTTVQWHAVKQYAAGAAQQGTFRVRVPPFATRVDITVTTTPTWSAHFELCLD